VLATSGCVEQTLGVICRCWWRVGDWGQALAARGGRASVFNAWGWALVAPGCVGGPYAAPALSLGSAKGQFNHIL
jgi:hypothetical protein